MHKGKNGFTLIEMLVVIVIIGVLAAIVAPRFFGKTDEAKVAAAKAQIEDFSMALQSYQLDTGNFPSTQQGLEALVKKPSTAPVPENWHGPYMSKNAIPKDPWNNAYVYTSPGKHSPDFDLLSYGKDGKAGGSGENADITNY
ncbi:type II secretion system major pseudopilin GspG [Desulfovibrio sp. JC010]|uniref:type II secretion system major pseudopilin GspG n=1 Tax=Desulfovibrio sp. JC010 TaxID=2593641 RepID=UPI0013D294E6|nr:type II secretion system protein GspG [Desulfovibrio sp. JC010]